MIAKGRWIGVLLLVLTVAFAATARDGGWFDEIVLTEEPSAAAAVLQLEAGSIDIYAFSIGDRALFSQVQASTELDYYMSFGSFNDLTFNPAGPVLPNGNLNPFGVPAFREAIHWLLDREYVANEIMGGLAVAKYSYLNPTFADATRYRAIMDEIEDYYAQDVDKAHAIMTGVMEDLGAALVDGTWQYNGSDVEIIALIRTEDERLLIGRYFAGLLEEFGFAVNRMERISRELSPLWISSNPDDGLWSFYTGGWVSTAIARDQGPGFNQFHTSRVLPWPLFAYLTIESAEAVRPGLWGVLDQLANRAYTTMDERALLFEEALWGCNQFANMIWVVDRTGFTPVRNNVAVASDLAGGVYASQMWGHTVQFVEDGVTQEGGTINISTSTLLIEPWNPVNGSNWVYDMFPIRSTGESGFAMDTNTGLVHPLHVERAEVTIKTGLPVGATLDWCTLDFADEIAVPTDAWADWDATTQTFITVGEMYPDGVTVNRRSVVYYPTNLYDTELHDGATISIADFVLFMIMNFDQAKTESAIYDEATVPGYDSFMSAFRGMRIVSENPLVIETYSDLYTLDAELCATSWFPYYAQGPGFWPVVTLGIMAEEQKLLAFSEDKSQALEIEWTNLTAGPSLEILEGLLYEAFGNAYIPYEPTMGQYLTLGEAANRWTLLENWYANMGHFWVGSGPYYLEEVFSTEKVIVLKQFGAYHSPSGRFQFLIDEQPEL